MNIFYEDAGQFKVASIVQKNESNYQVDTQHGKRIKVKNAHVYIEFNQALETFLTNAQQISADIDVSFLWEVCPPEEFKAEDLAQEYFGNTPTQEQLAAVLMVLFAAPMYFYKKGKGHFKAAPEETLKQALLAIEKRKQQEEQLESWVDTIVNGVLPDEIKQDLQQILHVPDKQSLTYKAYTKACEKLKTSALSLAIKLGGVTSIADYLYDGFVCKYFPKGLAVNEINVPDLPPLKSADERVKAFSIDDLGTTEIDDAFSLVDLGNGKKQLGIHIALPSLAIADASIIEQHIFNRQSTVYFPDGKITMLPENWLSAFSLDEGNHCPCLSMYIEIDEAGNYEIIKHSVEQVYIEANLRIQQIETDFNKVVANEAFEHFAHVDDMLFLYQFAIALQKKRDKYEPDAPKRYEYNLEIDQDGQVAVITRERGAPIEVLVSEMMILANSTWAAMLHEENIGAIFRVQPPMGKVRMSTKSEGHAGMGVSHYAWFTSPLRRNADYINQRQLLSIIDEQYALRFAANDSMLFAALKEFESVYASYADFQRTMEAYWSLIYIQQQQLSEVEGILLKTDLVRVEGLPMVAKALGIPVDIPPRTKMKLAITGMDEVTQTLNLRYINVLL